MRNERFCQHISLTKIYKIIVVYHNLHNIFYVNYSLKLYNFVHETLSLDYSKLLVIHQEFIKENMECQYGMLEALQARKVLSAEQVHLFTLHSIADSDKFTTVQNIKLLEFLQHSQSIHKITQNFLLALRETGQSHLELYIVTDGCKGNLFSNF